MNRNKSLRNIPRSSGRPKTVKVSTTVKVKKMGLSQKAATLSLVKQMIARDTENKVTAWQPELNVSHNSAIATGDCVPVMGKILEGTSSQTRVGDRIKPKRLTVRGTVSFASASFNTSQNIYARVIIAAEKTVKVGSGIGGSIATNQLLHPAFAGTGASQGFTGVTSELDYPVNTELFRVYMDKIVKLSPVYTLTANQSVTPTPTTAFRWSYTFKQLPANFTFDDANGDWVNNFAPFVAIGYAYADGTSPDVVATKLISNTYSVLSYEDA